EAARASAPTSLVATTPATEAATVDVRSWRRVSDTARRSGDARGHPMQRRRQQSYPYLPIARARRGLTPRSTPPCACIASSADELIVLPPAAPGCARRRRRK